MAYNVLVLDVLDSDGNKVDGKRIPLTEHLRANCNSTLRFRYRMYIETIEDVSNGELPYWDTRQ